MINAKERKEPLIVAIGGGKGGVGKSMVCSNLAIQYASAGFRSLILDLDLGAANVHTIFGMRQPPKGLGEFFTTPDSRLRDFIIDTDIENLRIIAGGCFVPELANLPHLQKVKVINQIKTLDADLVLLDLGAGTSSHVVDFFSICHAGIVVTTPEPTAIINAYEFLKNIIYRILLRMFSRHPQILQLIQGSSSPGRGSKQGTIDGLIDQIEKVSPFSAQNIRDVCSDFDFHLILNQGRKVSETQLGVKLRDLSKQFLSLNLTFEGMIFHNEEVSASIFKMTPVTIAYPDSVTSKTLKRLAIATFHRMANKMLEIPTKENDAENHLQQVLAHAQADYNENLIAQKRLYRARERATEETSAASKS
ncbi:Uncharacterized protein SCG7086_AZ_00060 [Chlamydiales bacterium SCGC AG-110-P3]|nr:Uncharacterized protein SCG7086_AZ_00060 [Chlamydiales bacterium SCGC AG-110-P3]